MPNAPETGDRWTGPRPPRSTRLASAFAGRGLFTVERPGDAAGLHLDYLLTSLDAFTWTAGAGLYVAQAENAGELELAIAAGRFAVYRERALVTNLDAAMFPDGWPDGWTCFIECYWNVDGGRPGVGRSVPRMLFEAERVLGEAFGKVPIVLVIGCYDAGAENPGIGIRLHVADYLPDLFTAAAQFPSVVGYCVWRMETLDGPDVEALK